MTRFSKKNQQTTEASLRDVLTHTLHASFLPIINKLDEGYDPKTDTGSDLPSMSDQGLKIYLGQIIQTINNQLYGYTNQATGKKTTGQLGWLSEAEYRVNSPQFQLRAECDNLTPADLRAWHYFELAEARVSMMTEHLQSFKAVYLEIFREEWKPYDALPAGAQTKTDAKAIAAKMKERFGKTEHPPAGK